jgi:Divergent InlB B-repeat domain
VRVTSECRGSGCPKTVTLADDRFPEPPPEPPKPVGRVLVQVSGNGTVSTTGASARGLQDSIQQIRCGVKGFACYSETTPGQQLTMQAAPASGQRFEGWTGGCTGKALTCTVDAQAATTVGATFAPARGRAVSAKLGAPRMAVRWSRSVGKGTLVATGSIGGSGTVRIQLRRPKGGALLTRTLQVRGGGFRLSAPLAKLAGGAKLFPGGFVVSLTGKAKGSALPLQVRTVSLPAPGEGVVRKAFAGTARGGPAVRRIRPGAREVWANFQFEAQPQLEPVTVSWYQGKKLLGTRSKSNRPVIETGIGSAAGISRGTYRVDLKAGARVVKRLSIRVR